MLKFVYTLLGYLLLPVLVCFLSIPRRGKKGYGKRLFELLGFYHFKPDPAYSGVIWFHTVSVGETVAATRLIKEFHSVFPQWQIVVTTTTTTGAEVAQKIGDFVTHLFAPLDYPHGIKFFLKKVQPKALIIMETELWPNWLASCRAQQIPVILMNARMSERSCLRYEKLGKLFTRYIGDNLTAVLCQNSEDGQRFSRLGLSNVKITGSLKYDLMPSDEQIKAGHNLRKTLPFNKIWIAASTHEGEDSLFLTVQRQLWEHDASTLLLLAPRHPQRFAQVYDLARNLGFKVGRLSDLNTEQSDYNVLLCDQMGVMYQLFTCSDIAVMGGSFVDVGGHNPLEPASLHKPVIMGPYYYNFKKVTDAMSDAGGLLKVSNEQELTSKLQHLLQHEDIMTNMGQLSFGVMQSGQGATQRTIDHLKDILSNLKN